MGVIKVHESRSPNHEEHKYECKSLHYAKTVLFSLAFIIFSKPFSLYALDFLKKLTTHKSTNARNMFLSTPSKKEEENGPLNNTAQHIESFLL